MAGTGKNGKQNGTVSEKTLRDMLRDQRIAASAVEKAQAENRRLGVPNWYSIGGEIVSDKEIADKNKMVNNLFVNC